MLIDPLFIEKVNIFLETYPASVTRLVTTPRRNATIGGAKKSWHLTGQAIDLVFDEPSDLIPAAKHAKDMGFGGIEADLRNNHLHLDIRPTVWHVVCTPTKTITLEEYLTSTQI